MLSAHCVTSNKPVSQLKSMHSYDKLKNMFKRNMRYSDSFQINVNIIFTMYRRHTQVYCHSTGTVEHSYSVLRKVFLCIVTHNQPTQLQAAQYRSNGDFDYTCAHMYTIRVLLMCCASIYLSSVQPLAYTYNREITDFYYYYLCTLYINVWKFAIYLLFTFEMFFGIYIYSYMKNSFAVHPSVAFIFRILV